MKYLIIIVFADAHYVLILARGALRFTSCVVEENTPDIRPFKSVATNSIYLVFIYRL